VIKSHLGMEWGLTFCGAELADEVLSFVLRQSRMRLFRLLIPDRVDLRQVSQ